MSIIDDINNADSTFSPEYAQVIHLFNGTEEKIKARVNEIVTFLKSDSTYD